MKYDKEPECNYKSSYCFMKLFFQLFICIHAWSPSEMYVLLLYLLLYMSKCIFTHVYLDEDIKSFSSVQFSCCSVVSNSLQSHESQHARPSCPSPTPRVWKPSNTSHLFVVFKILLVLFKGLLNALVKAFVHFQLDCNFLKEGTHLPFV